METVEGSSSRLNRACRQFHETLITSARFHSKVLLSICTSDQCSRALHKADNTELLSVGGSGVFGVFGDDWTW